VQVVLVTDSERQCSHCRDTGMMREENGHGGFVSMRCLYCNAYEKRNLGGEATEPRLPPLTRGEA